MTRIQTCALPISDDVPSHAGAANEELGGFENGGLDPRVAVSMRQVPRRSLHGVPIGLLGGQQILRSAGTLRNRGHGSTAYRMTDAMPATVVSGGERRVAVAGLAADHPVSAGSL